MGEQRETLDRRAASFRLSGRLGDLYRRVGRRQRSGRLGAAALALAVSAGAGVGLWTAFRGREVQPMPLHEGMPTVSPDEFSFSEGPAEPPVPFVAMNQVVGVKGPPIPLAASAQAPLSGWVAPVAMLTPDGRYVAYNSWEPLGRDGGRPSIRLHDLELGGDTVVSTGAYSFAWRADGVVAYFQRVDDVYRLQAPSYGGRILVEDHSSGPGQAVPWTPEARYIVAAWAGDTLLVYQQHEGEILDVLALDGPMSARVLARGAFIVALSPDGTKVVLAGGADGSDFGGRVRLVNVTSGEVLNEIDVPGELPLSYGGSWSGTRVVASAGDRLLAVFGVEGNRLTLDRAFEFPEALVRFGPYEPQFVDEEGKRFVGWAVAQGQGRRSQYVDCDLAESVCTMGMPRNEPFFRAYNPSRPASSPVS
jgi:hypothetical protein